MYSEFLILVFNIVTNFQSIPYYKLMKNMNKWCLLLSYFEYGINSIE